MVKLVTKREVTRAECPWLDSDIAPWTVVYPYTGCTYGCISQTGKAVSLKDGEEPFFELPLDAIMPAYGIGCRRCTHKDCAQCAHDDYDRE